MPAITHQLPAHATPPQRLSAAAAALASAWPMPNAYQAEQQQIREAAAAMAQPLSHSQLLTLAIAYHDAMQRITLGRGSDAEASTLAVASNIAMVLAELGLGDDLNLDTCITAQQHIHTMRERGLATGRWAFSGPGITAVNDLLTLHDQQLAEPDCTQAVLDQALRIVRERLEAGHVMTSGEGAR